MKVLYNVLIIVCVLFLPLLVNSQDVKKDSIYYNNKYYYSTDSDFEQVKKEYMDRNFETWFMPGIGYALYVPKGQDSTGVLKGIAINYLLFTHMSQNMKPGPSLVRIYAKLSIIKSSRSSINDLFSYYLGLSMSFEKNPRRSYLVPFFGLEFGGLSQSQWGTTGQFTPTVGIHIIAKRNLYINLQGGYVYTITNFDMLQGVFFEVGVNFALW